MIQDFSISNRPLVLDASGRFAFAPAKHQCKSGLLASLGKKTGLLLLLIGSLVAFSACATAQSTQETEEPSAEVDPPKEQGGMAMPISGIQTVFANDLTQWDVFDYDGERAGTLNLRFPVMTTGTGDLTQWVFRMGDFDGMIKPKVTGREDFWEIRVNNQVVTMRPVFPGQLDQWAISDGRNRIVYAVRDFALLEYWSTRAPGGPGLVEMYTRFEGDPTDWEFYDEVSKPVNAAQQLAMLWLPVYIRLTAL